MDSKNFYDALYDPTGTNYGGFNEAEPSSISRRELMLRDRTISYWKKFCNPDQLAIEIGASTGGLSTLFGNWIGLEYSAVAVGLAKKRFGDNINIVQSDAQSLDVESELADFIYSWATLEHVENPDLAFREIHRVLKPGAVACLKPAWNCRESCVLKLKFREYADLSVWLKIRKFLLPLSNNFWIRAAFMIPARLSKLLINLNGNQLDLRFKRLIPSEGLIAKYGHEPDDDAFSCFDIVDAVLFFQSRGYEIISHPTFIKKLFARGSTLVVRKPL